MEIKQVNIMLSSGVRYIGTLKDGLFHNSGCLLFPDGGTYHGTWDSGANISGAYRFPDGLTYSEEDWFYCSRRDRRFWSEICNGLPPGALESNRQPTPNLPFGHYDTGDGIYDPFEDTVRDYEGNFLRIPDEEEIQWIVKFCRRGTDEDFDGQANEALEEVLEKVSRQTDVKFTMKKVITEVVESVEQDEAEMSDMVKKVSLSSSQDVIGTE